MFVKSLCNTSESRVVVYSRTVISEYSVTPQVADLVVTEYRVRCLARS
jgi:hypothetical protein